jgi:hypothetical protein
VRLDRVTAANRPGWTRSTGRVTERISPEEQLMAGNTPNRRIVQRRDSGGWEVVKPGSSRASATARTQAVAQAAARRIVRNSGGGEVTTRGVNGRFRDSDTQPPGNDPNPPRDKR